MNPLIFVFTSLFLSTEVSVWAIEQVQEDFFGNNSYCDRWFRIWNSEISKICSVSVSSRNENSLLLFFTGSIYFIKISAELFYLLGNFHLKKFPITLFVSKICLSEKTQKILFSNYSVISSKKLWNQKTKRLHKGFKWLFVFSRGILQTKNELFCCFRCSFW